MEAAGPSRTALYAAMLTATLLWGSMPVAGKVLIGVVGPIQQSLVRGVSAAVVLTLFALLVAGLAPLRSAWARPSDVLIQAFLSFFGSSLTSLLALQFITASLQAVLVATFPVMLAAFELRQGGITPRALGGTLIAMAGIVVVVGGDDPRQVVAGGVDMRGVALGLLTAFIIACGQTYARRTVTTRGGDPIGITAFAAAASVPMTLAVALVFGDLSEIPRAPGWAQMVLAYLGVFCTAINFGLWYWGLKYMSAARAAPLQYLTTPLSVLLAWHILGEPLTFGLAIGTMLVIGGVWLTQSRRGAGRMTARPAQEGAR